MPYGELIERAAQFHPWDAMAPAALAGLRARGPFEATAETGCGGSTIVLSHASRRHLAFAIEGTDSTVSALRQQPGLNSATVTFVEGETRETLPRHRFDGPLDLALLDGPHAYPLPQIEFAYLFPHVRVGGWVVVDDLQIPSVHELFRFLEKEPSVALEEVLVRTAFFRRVSAPPHEPDGWAKQGMNRRTLGRYAWLHRLRRLKEAILPTDK